MGHVLLGYFLRTWKALPVPVCHHQVPYSCNLLGNLANIWNHNHNYWEGRKFTNRSFRASQKDAT